MLASKMFLGIFSFLKPFLLRGIYDHPTFLKVSGNLKLVIRTKFNKDFKFHLLNVEKLIVTFESTADRSFT